MDCIMTLFSMCMVRRYLLIAVCSVREAPTLLSCSEQNGRGGEIYFSNINW